MSEAQVIVKCKARNLRIVNITGSTGDGIGFPWQVVWLPNFPVKFRRQRQLGEVDRC